MTKYVAPFDRVRTHDLGNYPVVLRFLEDVKENLRLVAGVVDLHIGRVENEGKSLKVVIYLPMSETKSKRLSPLTRLGIL